MNRTFLLLAALSAFVTIAFAGGSFSSASSTASGRLSSHDITAADLGAIRKSTLDHLKFLSKTFTTEEGFNGLRREAEKFRSVFRKNGLDTNTHDDGPGNNYSNVWAYDFNRPKLDTNLYVNADYIFRPQEYLLAPSDPFSTEEQVTAAGDNFNRLAEAAPNLAEPQLIATQGPMDEDTLERFFCLLLEFEADLVIALGPAEENGATKFLKYFGEVGFHVMGDPTSADTLSTDSTSNVPEGIKLYKIKVDEPLRVGHSVPNVKTMTVLHFEKWMDMEAADISAPIWIAELMRKYKRVVVHCSAGVGRTGTMIAISTMYNSLVNVLHTVSSKAHLQEKVMFALDPVRVTRVLRAQRELMVVRRTQLNMLIMTAVALLDKFISRGTNPDDVERLAALYFNGSVPKISFRGDETTSVEASTGGGILREMQQFVEYGCRKGAECASSLGTQFLNFLDRAGSEALDYLELVLQAKQELLTDFSYTLADEDEQRYMLYDKIDEIRNRRRARRSLGPRRE